jgi:chloramphenicol O-acetyltransferase type A
MKEILLSNWKRLKHYKFFKKYEYPHFNLCVNMDISKVFEMCKKKKISLFLKLLFEIMKIANSIDEFKTRIRKNKVVIHDIVHPGITVLSKDNLYGNCAIDFCNDFEKFVKEAKVKINEARKKVILEENQKFRDDFIFVTEIPWVSFTNVTHPLRSIKNETIPRIAIGKYFAQDEKVLIPVSVQGNHCLMDGYHAGLFYNLLQIEFNK